MGLDGSRAKLRRASQHLEALKREADSFFEANLYRIAVEPEIDELHYVARVKDPPALPSSEWALTIGDCIHNLRCSLDYIAWALAGADLDDTLTQFPIFDSERAYKARGTPRMIHLPAEARSLIQRVQPYQSDDPVMAPLSLLRRLDNRNKHKLLSVVAAMPERFRLNALVDDESAGQPKTFIAVTKPRLVHNAKIATLVFSAPPKVQMDTLVVARVVFGEGMGPDTGLAVFESLDALVVEVGWVIDAFDEKFF